MNRSVSKPFRTLLVGVGISIAAAAFIALALLAGAQFLPDEFSNGRIQWGDYSTPMSGVFSGGVIEFVIAFGAVTVAVLIAVFALLFAMVVMGLVLAFMAGALLVCATVIASPLIAVVAVTWWLVRRSSRQRPAAAA